jgi:hypothetical protein
MLCLEKKAKNFRVVCYLSYSFVCLAGTNVRLYVEKRRRKSSFVALCWATATVKVPKEHDKYFRIYRPTNPKNWPLEV